MKQMEPYIEPKPVEELEYVCEIGGEFDEASVTLSVFSTKLDRHLVTQLLRVNPTKAWNPNEPHPLGTKGKTRVVDWGKWYLSIEADTMPVEEKIKSLLAQCTDNLEHWHTLACDYEISLTIGGHLKNWNRELDLSPQTLKLLADRNLSLKVDVYLWGPDED